MGLITLSFRMDGLAAMCAKDAIIHYVPQDLAILLAMYLSFKSFSASVNSCGSKIEDPDAALAAWAEKKGVDVSALECKKGKTWRLMSRSSEWPTGALLNINVSSFDICI